MATYKKQRYAAMRQMVWENIAAADDDGVHAAITLTTAKDVNTGITNPATPRNLSITGTKAGASLTGDVVITGKDQFGKQITETIALNDDTTVYGKKAFAQVTNIHAPAKTTTADTVKIGWGNAIGVGDKMTMPLGLTCDGCLDVIAAHNTSSTLTEENTVTPTTVPNGTHDYHLVFAVETKLIQPN